MALRRARVAMLGEEELVQQPVDLKQSVAAQAQDIFIDPQKAALLQLPKLGREAVADVDPELVGEVVAFDAAQLHLKDEFPNHALFFGRRQRTVDRKPAFPNFADVGAELV